MFFLHKIVKIVVRFFHMRCITVPSGRETSGKKKERDCKSGTLVVPLMCEFNRIQESSESFLTFSPFPSNFLCSVHTTCIASGKREKSIE